MFYKRALRENMGKNRIPGRFLFFYIVLGLVMIATAGCQYSYYPKLSIETMESREGREYLQNAKVYAEKKDFKSAFEENEKAYEFFPPGLKQEAIFQKGLLYAHPANPNRSIEKAIVCFELVGESGGNTVLEINSEFILSILRNYSLLVKNNASNTRELRKNKNRLELYVQELEKLSIELDSEKKYGAKLKKQIKQLKDVDLKTPKKLKSH